MQKTYAQKKQAREERSRAIVAIMEGFTFTSEPRLTFRAENTRQDAYWAISRADTGDRYLLLQSWPDLAQDPYDSRWTAFGPPGSQKRGKLVCEAARSYLANAFATDRDSRGNLSDICLSLAGFPNGYHGSHGRLSTRPEEEAFREANRRP